MCWNGPVSITFGLVGLACAAFLLCVGRRAIAYPSKPIVTIFGRPVVYTKATAWHAMFVANIACVEMCEFLIWHAGPKPLASAGTQDTCDPLNAVGTYGVFIFGFVNWMWIVSLWAYMSSNEGNDKPTFQLYLVLGVVTSIGYIIKIGLGDVFQLDMDFWGAETRWSYDPNVSVVTCSFQETGRYPHLHWRFNMSPQAWLPSGFAWFAVGLMPLFFYKPRGTAAVVSAYGALTYVIPKVFLPPEETMSMYWWLGFGFEIIFIAEPFVRTLFCVPLSKRSSTVRAVERFSVRVDNLTLRPQFGQRTSEYLPKIDETNNRASLSELNASI